MRDPVDAKIEEARLAASMMLAVLDHLGALRGGVALDADPVRIEARRWLRAHRQDMPPHLFTFFNELIYEAHGAAVRKGRRRPNTARDFSLIFVINALVVDYGLDATRNKTRTTRPSACSIVAEALAETGHAISEEAIEAVWSSRPPDCPKQFAELFGTT
jgi:hypothetical protein